MSATGFDLHYQVVARSDQRVAIGALPNIGGGDAEREAQQIHQETK